MPNNDVPLQKTLLHLDLSKGVNERDRPEVANPAVCLTKMDNLLQDQTGAYVKRPGDSVLATQDDGANNLSNPSNLLRFKDGLGLIANRNTLYNYQEGLGKFRSAGSMPDFEVVKADFVTSSGPTTTPYAYAVASNAAYHAVVTYSRTYILTVYDRESGSKIAGYDLNTVFNGVLANRVVLAFIDGRYLLCATNTPAAGDTVAFTIDTDSALPAQASITPVTLMALGGAVRDVAVGTSRAFVAHADGADEYITAVDTACAVVATRTLNNSGASDYFIYAFGTNVWHSRSTVLGAVDQATLAVDTYADTAHGVTGNHTGFCLDASGYVWWGTESSRDFSCWRSDNPITAPATLRFTMTDWQPMAAPFTGIGGTKVYAHLQNSIVSTADTLASHVVVCISESSLVTHGGQTYRTVRPEANLELHTGLNSYPATRFFVRYLPVEGDDYNYCPVVASKTAASSYAFAMFTLSARGQAARTSETFGGSNHISGGVQCSFDGNTLCESGFVGQPRIDVATSAVAGPIPAGSYKYVSVWRYVDAMGNSTYSRVSPVASVTHPGAFEITMTAYPPVCTMRERSAAPYGPDVVVDVYRTLTGGTIYYHCASNRAGSTQVLALAASGAYVLGDTMLDAVLATQTLLFRQPGTANSAVDRYPPPASNILCQHKDRLFTTDPYGTRVYYSSFFVDGESAWFNPVFSFFVHGGSGPITGLVSMDGRLFVFKRDGVFVVDGDGPAEGGVTGNEYSPPQRLATEFGCIDQESICLTTEGIVYRSPRGIELLTRSLQVKWIGDRVQTSVNANPKTLGTALDTFGRVHILVAASDPDTSTVTGVTGCELVWDIPADAWTIQYHTCDGAVYGRAMQDICLANLNGTDTLTYADPTISVLYADDTTSLDRATSYTPFVLETGWIRVGQQTRQRITEVLFLAKKRAGANHALKIQVAYDFVDTYTQTHVWEPSIINGLTIEELALPITKPQSLAIRVKITDQTPADTGTYPVGLGLGCDVLGTTFEVAPKAGAPNANRGGTSYTQPYFSGLSPITGTVLGGDTIRIFGRGFTGATFVYFDGVAATNLTVISDTEVTCDTPVHAAGTEDVVVVTPGGTVTGTGVYTYV